MRMHILYLRSQIRHKWFVFLECCKLGIPWLGVIHDWSKFLPSEWWPYARYFYGNYPKEYETHEIFPNEKPYTGITREDVEYWFDIAWLHHQHRNKHHWQRWLLTLDSARSDGKLIPLQMPRKYRLEMLADWQGAGRAYGNPNTKEWYLAHRDEIQLHSITRIMIEADLKVPEYARYDFRRRHGPD